MSKANEPLPGSAGKPAARGTEAPRRRKPSAVSLDCAPERQEVEVLEISSGRGAAHRLAQIGVRPGERLRVRRRAPMGGPVLVEIAGSAVAIGRSLARRIMVRPVAEVD